MDGAAPAMCCCSRNHEKESEANRMTSSCLSPSASDNTHDYGQGAARGRSAILVVEPATSTFILQVRTSIRRICVAGATTYLVLRKLCQQYHTSKHMCCTARVHTSRGIQAQLRTAAEIGLREQPVLRHMLILSALVHGERHTSPLKNDVANGQKKCTRCTQHSQFQRCLFPGTSYLPLLPLRPKSLRKHMNRWSSIKHACA